VRAMLRGQTREAHARLDGLWTDRALSDRLVYAAFLRGIAGAVVPLEDCVAAAGGGAVIPDWTARRRSAALLADLDGLGTGMRASRAVAPAGGAEVFGILYVLEGSRLGGALLDRRAGASADPAVLANRRFLQHGQGAGLWRSFLEQLEAAARPAFELDRICRRATQAFAVFEAAAQEEIARAG